MTSDMRSASLSHDDVVAAESKENMECALRLIFMAVKVNSLN